MHVRSAFVIALLAGIVPALAQTYHQGVVTPGVGRSEDVQMLIGGGYVSVGSTYSSPSFDQDILVSRHAPDGTTLWALKLGTLGVEYGGSVAEGANGDIVFAGLSDSGALQRDLVLVGISASGAVQWANRYPHTTQNGCYDCSTTPTIKKIVDPQPPARGTTPLAEFAIVHHTTITPQNEQPYSSGVLLLIDALGNEVFHQRAESTLASLGEGVVFNDVVYDPQTAGLAIVGSYVGFTPQEQLSSDALFVRFDLLSRSYVLSMRYNLTDPFQPLSPNDEFGRGVDVQPQIATRNPKNVARFLLASEYFGFSTFNAALTMCVDDAGTPYWSRTQRDFVPPIGTARWDYSYNAAVAGYYYFGDGGRLARMISYDSGGVDRFMRTYDPSYNTGFAGLAIANPNFIPSQYLASGDHAVPFVFDNNALFTRTDTMGAVGCADALEFLDPDLPVVTATPTPLVVAPISGSQAWLPSVSVLAASDETLCTPPCPSDVDDGTGTGTPGGGTDINDLLYVLNCFDLGDPCGDVDDDGADPQNPDGGTDINDLLFFLMHFELGC